MNQRLMQLAQHADRIRSPAFVVDEARLGANAAIAAAAVRGQRSRLLYAMKSFSVVAGLERIARSVDGLHASSLFEARLAREVLGTHGLVHLTAPCLRADEFGQLCRLCDYISFNSLTQWEAYRGMGQGGTAFGLRVNPQQSHLEDARYDPCRRHSKLGVPLAQLAQLQHGAPAALQGISGVLIHSNCDADDFGALLDTVRRLDASLGPLLERLEWINLGGGYLFDEAEDLGPLREAIDLLRSRTDAELLFEPGAAISRAAGYLVSEVVDMFESDGVQVAVLDTSVNHMPEVFEYQFAPDVAGERDGGAHRYLFAGATCLAGDLLGEHAFDEPLRVGERVVFENCGAYTLVKASMFNGINLPSIYLLTESGRLELKRAFSYEDFLARCGAEP